MIQHAKAANARLLKVFPEGLRSGCDAPSAHHDAAAVRPQQPTSTRSTPPAARSWPTRSLPDWKLKAFKYYYIPWKAHSALAGIVVEPTDGSALRLQQELIDAVAPFTEKTGTACSVRHHAGRTRRSRPTDRSTTWRQFRRQKRRARNSIRTSPSACAPPGLPQGDACRNRSTRSRSRQRGRRFTNSATFGTARKELKAWELEP